MIGMITSFFLVEYIKKKIGEENIDGIGEFMVMYINIIFWPFFLPMMIYMVRVEAKKKGGEQ